MIRATTFAGRSVALFGLGGSGLATVRSLVAGGAKVAAWDDNEAARAAGAAAGAEIVDLATADWSAFAALVLAPGVPLTHPKPHWTVEKAKAAKVEIIGDIEIFFRERKAHAPAAAVIAITGTNGKSTTTALIAHILRSSGFDAQMGGNIGKPVLELASPAEGRIYVIEMSSFQIDLTPSLAPTIGVLLNITPDHLDRHGPAEEPARALRNYAGIKRRLVAQSAHAVIGIDDDHCKAIARDIDLRIPVIAISARGPAVQFVHHFFADASRLCFGTADVGPPTLEGDLSGVATLRGTHNMQNALAALATASLAVPDIPWSDHVTAMHTYPGLPHRMEEVGRLGHILFINDSKATNADSTEKALASFDRHIFWILGGKPKEGGITALAPYFSRITKAYLIGEASEEFALTLEGKLPFERSGTLDIALAAATRDARMSPGVEPVVLLSPACASYDQFKSFEHRGNEFRRMVCAIPGIVKPCRPA